MAMKDAMEAIRFVFTTDFWRMSIYWTLALVSSYLRLLKATPIDISKQLKKTGPNRPICVITGVTSGIGKSAAFGLAEMGYHVVLVGRSSKLLAETLKDIKKVNKDAQLKTFQADMSSFKSIFKFKNSLEQWLSDSKIHPSIQLLVNNAGILGTSYGPSIDGYDRMMATGYIGAFSLTKLLLPLLKNSIEPSRVVNVSSFTHRCAPSWKFDKKSVTGAKFSNVNRYPCSPVYEYSKLCILLFSYELHRQLRLSDGSRHVTVIAIDPGLVKTNLMREIPTYIVSMVFLAFKILGFLKTPDDGAESITDAAFAPPEVSGKYYFGGKGRHIESSKVSRNRKHSKQLWDTSCHLFKDLHHKQTKLNKHSLKETKQTLT